VFLIPAEELEPAGLRAPFRAELLASGLVSPDWLARFEAAFALYFRRARALAERAARHFLPPRAQNLCLVRDPRAVRPWFQPLGRASCLLDHAAFEPARGSLEFATYQFFHVERLGLARAIVPALVQDFGYWLALTQEERLDFAAGCRRAEEGRASGWRALARALEWIVEGAHETLKPTRLAHEALVPIPGSGYLLPQRHAGELAKLERAWTAAAEERRTAYFTHHAASSAHDAPALLEWLARARPLVLVTGKTGEILWDPERPAELERLRGELADATSAALANLRADLEVVGARSRAFLASLVDPSRLPRPGPTIDQNGLAYIHRERKLVAYNVHEPGMQRLREPSVPFERWMLAARTIHEWGHLAVDAGFVAVPERRQQEFESVQLELARLFDAIVTDAPSALRAHAARALAELARAPGGIGRGLVTQCLGRMSDWQANLLAQRYLAPEERETYVRNNVRPLLGELDSAHLFQALARYAFEYQYLCFDPERDAHRYFLACTWFGEQFLARGVLDEARLELVLDAVGRLCRCHEVEAAAFRTKEAAP
jgi:hypothetical protein